MSDLRSAEVTSRGHSKPEDEGEAASSGEGGIAAEEECGDEGGGTPRL
jgi:hypothetical protein